MYGALFTSTIKGPEQAADWRATWRLALEGIKAEQIKTALEICAKNQDGMPSPAKFRKLCLPSIDYERLFIDAANEKFSNPLTYWAAQNFGLFELRRMSYPAAKERWIKIVDQLAAEHTLPSVPEPKPALPPPGQTTNREVALKSLDEAKKALKMADPCRRWACEPKSQAAVDLMFRDPPMTEEIEIATQNGFIVGSKWIPPEKRRANGNP